MGSGDLPFDLEWGTRASSNVSIDEVPGDEASELAATQKALVRDRSSGQRAWPNDGLPALLKRNRRTQRRMPWTDRRNLAATKPYEVERRGRATRWRNNDEVQRRWNWRSQRNQRCSTGAVADHVFSEKMPPVLGRRESTTRSRLKHPMSRWALKTRAKPRSSGQRRAWAWEYACWKPKTTSTTRPRERRRPQLKAWRDCDRRRHRGARSDRGAESNENAGQSLQSPDRRSADASAVRVQSEDQRTAGLQNGGRRSRRKARHVMLTGCAVRDSEDGTASRHQDGSRQVR